MDPSSPAYRGSSQEEQAQTESVPRQQTQRPSPQTNVSLSYSPLMAPSTSLMETPFSPRRHRCALSLASRLFNVARRKWDSRRSHRLFGSCEVSWFGRRESGILMPSTSTRASKSHPPCNPCRSPKTRTRSKAMPPADILRAEQPLRGHPMRIACACKLSGVRAFFTPDRRALSSVGRAADS
jgi:hypothetical protein